MSSSSSSTMGVLPAVEVTEARAVSGSLFARSCSEIIVGDLVFFEIFEGRGVPQCLPCAVVMADTRDTALTSAAVSCKYQINENV